MIIKVPLIRIMNEWFPALTEASVLQDFAKKKFAPSTKKKALWAGCIFEQWKCIRNYKLKQQDKLDEVISTNLNNMEVKELNKVLSYFIMEIRKQNGDKYP